MGHRSSGLVVAFGTARPRFFVGSSRGSGNKNPPSQCTGIREIHRRTTKEIEVRNLRLSICAQYLDDVFLDSTVIHLGASPSISGKEELILMTEKTVLIEKSFADAIAMIAAAKELPEHTRRHWPTSLRKSPKLWTSRWR